MISVAIFADVHGKCLLPFKLAAWYMHISGHKLDAILQCGDIGAYPTLQNMDKATLRHLRHDRDERGFMDDFCRDKPEVRRVLDNIGLTMYCVRGNHEDHAFLDALEHAASTPSFPIDCYGRIHVLKTGHILQLSGEDGDTLRILGVGRIGDDKGREHPPFIQAYERQVLQQLCKQKDFTCDVLLTHDKPPAQQGAGSMRSFGMTELDNVLDHIPFAWHFHGHTGEPYHQVLDSNGITQRVKVKELEFNEKGKLSSGCMVILEKTHDDIRVFPVPLHEIIHFDQATWRQL